MFHTQVSTSHQPSLYNAADNNSDASLVTFYWRDLAYIKAYLLFVCGHGGNLVYDKEIHKSLLIIRIFSLVIVMLLLNVLITVVQ